MPRVRVHQHVNPLAPYYRFAPKPLDVTKIFADPDLPLHLDIGCARGRFILKMAEITGNHNFAGIEIREPLVEEASRLAKASGLKNLHYEFCNATFALDQFLEKLPAGILQTVTIQFPDPWFKNKHAKRRMVRHQMVEMIITHLNITGEIFIQTDVDFLADEMFAIFRENASLREIEIAENPFNVKTERELAVEEKGLPVFRRIFEKVK